MNLGAFNTEKMNKNYGYDQYKYQDLSKFRRINMYKDRITEDNDIGENKDIRYTLSISPKLIVFISSITVIILIINIFCYKYKKDGLKTQFEKQYNVNDYIDE